MVLYLYYYGMSMLAYIRNRIYTYEWIATTFDTEISVMWVRNYGKPSY